MRRLTIIVTVLASLGVLPAMAHAADPVSFASSSAVCTGYGTTVNFPVVSTYHSDAIYRLTSTGASGVDGANFDLPTFTPGDQVWGDAGAINAGTAPSLSFSCTGGTISLDLYDRPNPPTTISGISSSISTTSELPFTVLHSGQYVVDVSLDQGAVQLQAGFEGLPMLTIARSGEYSLGSLDTTTPNGGNWGYMVWGMNGPTAHWLMTVREVPVQISALAFPSGYTAPGTPITAPFSVSGDTSINAYIHNAAGQVVSHLGAWNAAEGQSSVTWDGLGDGGARFEDGTYWLHLDSTDPNGNVTSAETSVFVDGTPPSVVMTSPATVTPTQAVSFRVSDTGSGTAGASAYIDGDLVASELSGNGTFTLVPQWGSWSLGSHSWEIQASDNVGNSSDVKGSFTAANPSPPSPPPPPPPPSPAPIPPTPRITAHPPSRTTNRSATFRFADSTSGVTYQYQLDHGAFRSGNPAKYTNLAYQRHTLRVWAKKNGRASKTISFSWTVARKKT